MASASVGDSKLGAATNVRTPELEIKNFEQSAFASLFVVEIEYDRVVPASGSVARTVNTGVVFSGTVGLAGLENVVGSLTLVTVTMIFCAVELNPSETVTVTRYVLLESLSEGDSKLRPVTNARAPVLEMVNLLPSKLPPV